MRDRVPTVIEAHVNASAELHVAGDLRNRELELKHFLQRFDAVLVARIDNYRTAALRTEGAAGKLLGRGWNFAQEFGGDGLSEALGLAYLDASASLPHQIDVRLGHDDAGTPITEVENVTQSRALLNESPREILRLRNDKRSIGLAADHELGR